MPLLPVRSRSASAARSGSLGTSAALTRRDLPLATLVTRMTARRASRSALSVARMSNFMAGSFYSTFSTKTRIVPPQDRPTFQAVSSATPNSSIFGLPLSITSSASVTTAPSTQPPDTEPRKLPSPSMTRLEPTGRGAEPQVSTTVASATALPFLRQSSAALRMSLSVESMSASISKRYIRPNIMRHATFCIQALGSPARSPPRRSAATSPAMDSRLWIGRNSSTWGSMVLMPRARASNPSKRNSGLSQMRRRQERCSRSISNASVSSASRSSPSVMRRTMAPWVSTRRAHSLLKLCSDEAMRVPPDQSGTLAEQADSASSGSRSRSARVTLVSRVPNRNVLTRFRASVRSCRKCKKMRLYWLIEPEISSSATIGGGLVFGPMKRRSMKSPPPFMLARKVRRMSIRWPRGCGARRRVRISERQHQALHRLLGGGDLGAGHLREIFLLQDFAVGHRHAGVELDLALFLELVVEAGEQRLVHAGGAGLRRRRRPRRRLRQHHRQQLIDIAAAAEEDAKRLVEQHRMLVPLHEYRVERPVKIIAGADTRGLHRFERIEHGAGADGNAGSAQGAGEVDDVLGEAARLLPLPSGERDGVRGFRPIGHGS